MQRFLVGILLGGLLFAGNAWAKDVEFGLSDVKYKITVPENWDKREFSGGVQLTSEDKKTSLAVTILKKEGINVNAIQQMLHSKLGLTEVKKEELHPNQKAPKRKSKQAAGSKPEPEHAIVTGFLEGVPLRIELKEAGSCLVSIVSAGDEEGIKNCLATLVHEKQPASTSGNAGK
ncbi:MAG: hypothetical protein IJT59_07610 [Desulfovibrionaceae bacterium]|nr:hypothetical protein [Desulfovibrionaceae bacterium]